MANRNDPFFSRLTKLFRSGPAIQRRVKGYDYKSYYDNQLVRGNLGYRGPFPFGRESSPFSVLGAYGILDRMARYCLSGDVLVATNTQQGFISMKDLAAEFAKPVTERKKHYTFSYEPNSDSIVLREILDAFKTKKDRLVEVHYDNGAVLRCTADHRIMLRDGTYREARYLQPGDAVMPFYRKTLKKYKNNNDYRVVYSPAEGWKGEHKIVGDYIRGTKILPEEMLHVHHKNFIGIDNEIDNLMIMPAVEHLAYHSKLGTRHSIEKSKHWAQILNTKESCAIVKMKNGKYRKRKAEKAIRYPKCIQNGFSNPNADSEFIIEDIKKNWESGITLADLCSKCGVHQGKLLSRLQWAGYEGYSDFVRKCFDSKYLVNYPKPRFPSELPDIQSIYSFYRKGMTQTQIAKHFGFKTGYSILSALRKNGYNTWYDFTTTYQNNKVVRVVETDQIEDVYDLTVEGTHNFAVIDPKTMQPCGIVHNSEFAEMEYQPEIAAALNIFADETAAGDEKGKAFHLYSKNPEVKKALEELFYDILNIDFNLRPWIRNLVKYGDFFLYNEVIPDIGIVNVQPIPVNELEREEGFDQHDPYAVRYKWLTRGNRYLENWQVTHMRVLGNDLFLPYGTSLLEPARRIWRQLMMMEDSMLVYRVVRSPERRVFYIDVGNVAPNDVPSYMEAVKQTMRSRDVVDRTNGRMDQRYNPLSIDEDYFIPVRGGQTGTKIETLAGGQNATAVDDVKYLQQKLFAAIQVPKPYLNFDENLSAKASLAQQDVRFSRTISVLQRVVISELNKMAMVHLYSKGFDGEDLIAFELKLSNPSTVAMQQKLEAMSTKFEIAGKAKETKLVDQDWIQKKILDLTDDDIIRIEAGIRRDKIREVEIEAVAVKENLPERDTTTSPFDPSNYTMPGGNVKKNPPIGQPIGGNANTPIQPKNVSADMQAVATSGVSVAGQPSASPDAAPAGMPIKATPFLSAARHNDRRRVGMAGRGNLSMPDFKDILSGNNKYMTDINDKETLNLKSQFTTISEDINLELEYKAPPVISRDMKHLMSKLDEYFEKNGGRKNKKILTENEVRLDKLNEEQLFEMELVGDEVIVESYEKSDKNSKNEDKNDDLDLSILD